MDGARNLKRRAVEPANLAARVAEGSGARAVGSSARAGGVHAALDETSPRADLGQTRENKRADMEENERTTRPKPRIEDLQQEAEDALLAHMLERANVARARHGGALGPHNMAAVLLDSEAVRFPSRVVYGDGPLDAHQFAQPEPDPNDPAGYVVYLRPKLAERPDLAALAISYVIPLINYGAVVRTRHVERYGARLMELTREEYVERLCAMADWLGLAVAEEKPEGDAASPPRDR